MVRQLAPNPKPELFDRYLRADNEADMLVVLREAGLTSGLPPVYEEFDELGEPVFVSDPEPERILDLAHTSIHVLGVLQRQTGTTTDEAGSEVPVFEPLPGWHVNVRTRDPAVAAALQSYDVAPNTPLVVWAGGSDLLIDVAA